MARANENTYILQPTSQSSLTSSKAINDDNSVNQSSNSDTQDTRQLVLESITRLGPTSNLHQTGFNYVNSIIGSGVIGIPYALKKAGFGFGIILLIFIATITDYSLCILVKGGNLAGVNTYQDLVEAAFGRSGFYLLTFIQFIYPFIAMISYNVIIGDTTTKVFIRLFNVSRESALGNRNSVVFFCTLLVTLPLSLYRNIAKLNKISLLSLFFIILILVFIVFRIDTYSHIIPPSESSFAFIDDGITEAVGIMAFAYMCHHSSFLLYEALENPTQKRWNQITHISVASSWVIVMAFGIAGYVTFSVLSQGDLLENYCIKDDLANIARLLFSITIMLTYPIECFVVREVLENALWGGKPPSTKSHHILITLAIVVSCFILSTLTDCLGIVLELNGVLAAVPLAFILPAICYIKLDPGRVMAWDKLPAFILAFFGITVAVIGSIISIGHVINGVKCSHGVELNYCQSFKSKSLFSNYYQNSTNLVSNYSIPI